MDNEKQNKTFYIGVDKASGDDDLSINITTKYKFGKVTILDQRLVFPDIELKEWLNCHAERFGREGLRIDAVIDLDPLDLDHPAPSVMFIAQHCGSMGLPVDLIKGCELDIALKNILRTDPPQ